MSSKSSTRLGVRDAARGGPTRFGVAVLSGLLRRGRVSLAAAASLSVAAFGYAACTEKSKPADVADADQRRELLANLGEHVLLTTYRDFAGRAEGLERALNAYAEALDDETRNAAQAALRDALLSWERAEVYQVGPAADVTNFNPGARGLRAEIYAWQDANPCAVDRGLVNGMHESDDFEGDVYAYARDLSAIERLLFDGSTATACAASDRVVTPAAWQALVESDLTQRRARFAVRAGAVVREKADALVSEFEHEFLPQLAQAGAGSKLFDRTQEALNALTNALFYLDYDVRDMKLGGPLGHTMACSNVACPTELPHSKLSKRAVRENLLAFRAVFQGHLPDAAAPDSTLAGLNDLLASVGAQQLADEIDAAVTEALEAVDAVEPDFEAASRAEGGELARAFDALQALADLLKTEFLQKLALNEPMRASGDND
ncbi:MAG TPA: imelysin family protein [Polyangiales bacterium]